MSGKARKDNLPAKSAAELEAVNPAAGIPTIGLQNQGQIPRLTLEKRLEVEHIARQKTFGNPWVILGLLGAAIASMLSLVRILANEDDKNAQLSIFTIDAFIYASTLTIELYAHYSEIEDLQILFYLFAPHAVSSVVNAAESPLQKPLPINPDYRSPGVYSGIFKTSVYTFIAGVLAICGEIIAITLNQRLAAGIIGIVAPIVTTYINALKSKELQEEFQGHEARFLETSHAFSADYLQHDGISAYQYLKRNPCRFMYATILNQTEIESRSDTIGNLKPLRLVPGNVRP